MSQATEMAQAADREKLEMRRIAMAICDVLGDYIPRACQTDAEVHLVEFLCKNKIRIVSDAQQS